VDRQGLEFYDVAESRYRSSTTRGGKVSSCGEDIVPIRGQGLVFSLRNLKAVGMHADIAAALKLVFEDNSLIHILAESSTCNVAGEKNGLAVRLVCPFVKEVG
jgi:hypothetical protein